MSELESIAKSVAQALGLEDDGNHDGWREPASENRFWYLICDGSNVFSEHWFQRCVLWLLEHKYNLDVCHSEFIKYPAVEFPARCIHALVSGRT